jgi:hypothetical protein
LWVDLVVGRRDRRDPQQASGGDDASDIVHNGLRHEGNCQYVVRYGVELLSGQHRVATMVQDHQLHSETALDSAATVDFGPIGLDT